ncbi:hypothetical protein [Paraburkholderia dilworthii]|uniref:hypothetical protein n=1 Tax=Paraburkholderia dilworthii TaxID=948106 RepID=UPI000489C165|nr:hypothetical protein [Paraburkholderia dilworthii]
MLTLDEMVKELGTVTIRHSAGMYHANAVGMISCGDANSSDSISGAVWNALNLKRSHERAAPDAGYPIESSANL